MHKFAIAHQNYQDSGKKARVMGANAHQLIVILFEELLNLMDEISIKLNKDENARIHREQSSVAGILDSLIDGLDETRSSSIASSLHLIYRQLKALIVFEDQENRLENIGAAKEILSEIASA